MAISKMKLLSPTNYGADGAHTVTIGTRSSLVLAFDDVEDTQLAAAATAAELLAPFSYTGSFFRWIKRGAGCNRIRLSARYLRAQSASANPVVQVFGVIPVPNATSGAAPNEPLDGIFPNDGTWRAIRLTEADDVANGITLDPNSSSSDMNDATYAWTLESPEIDLQDCHYFGVLPHTRATMSSNSPVSIWARGLA